MEILTPLPQLLQRVGRRLGLFVLALIVLPGWSAAADGDSLEYGVKAAYLTKFGIYVEWPAAAFAAADSPLVVCIAGDDPFGATLDAAAAGQRIDAHAITVRRIKTVARDSGCHILYLGGLDVARAAQMLDALRGAPVLTVSDARNNGSGASGIGPGMINFVIKDNRVRFNVDEEAAAASGLTISSKLLGLALGVKARPAKEVR